MSTKTGQSGNRKRSQKYQNGFAYKANAHKSPTDPKTKLLHSMIVTNCCTNCTGVIEWKITYGKYKPLKQPAKCINCSAKKVRFAYQVLCQDCVDSTGHCAKCNKKEEIVNTPQPRGAEAQLLEAEFELELKSLPERKRRTFLRYLKAQETKAAENTTPQEIENVEEGETPLPPKPNLTQIRQEAKKKLTELKEKFSLEDDFDDLDFGDDDDFEDSDIENSEN